MPNDYILRSDVEKMIKKQDLYGFGGTNFVHYDELLESISSIQSVDVEKEIYGDKEANGNENYGGKITLGMFDGFYK